MAVEERVERESGTTDEPQAERRPTEAQRAAVVEAAYILEAVRK